MKKAWIYILIVIVGIAGFVAYRSNQPAAVVDVIQPTMMDLRAYVEEQAVTELPHDHLIAMPIGGWLQPIKLREGDPVEKGQAVARLDVEDLRDRVHQSEHRMEVLKTNIAETEDNRLEYNALEQIQATVDSFDKTVAAAEAQLEASRALMEFAETELKRIKTLEEANAAPSRELRAAELQYRQATAEFRSDDLELKALQTMQAVTYLGPKFIKDYIDRKNFDKASYEQQLEEASGQHAIEKRNLERAKIESPIDGVVLERHQTRRQYLQAGTPLLTLGRLDDMEIIAEVLTEQATRIKPGNPVDIFGKAIADGPITGKVLRVYPAGFKKISSLGVEQQRVNVAIGMDQRPRALGIEYRVQVRIYHDQADNVMTLPRTALFRGDGGQWQAMLVRNGVTELRDVELGLMNNDRAAVLKGLSESDQVVAHPSQDITANLKVDVVTTK